MAEEVKEPQVTIPRSIYLALGISTGIYMLVSIVSVGLAGTSVLAQSDSPLAVVMGLTGSPEAVLVISLGAMIATASILLTTIMGISRIVFSMARNKDLPALLAEFIPRFNTPHYAIAITGVCMIIALLLADLVFVVAVSTFAMLIYYLIANIAALRLPPEHRQYPSWIPGFGVISSISLIIFMSLNSWIIGGIGLCIGSVWFNTRKKRF